MTDNPARRGGRTGGDQLTVWNTESEAAPPMTSPVPRRPRRAHEVAHINPAMAEWARRGSALGEELAAKRLRIKPETLLAWETGAAKPSIPQLRRLARLYKRPLAAFYLPAPPRHFTVARDFRRLPDQPPMAFSTALLFAQRIAGYRRDVVLELEPETAAAAFVGSASTDTPAPRLGQQVRALLGIGLDTQRRWAGPYPALNGWKNAVEELGILVFHFSGVKESEVRGFSISEAKLPVIALNGGDSVNARIFTLIHELIHLFLGEGGNCDLADFTHPQAPSLPVETYANAAAAEVLVPAAALLAVPAVAAATGATEWSDADLEGLAHGFRVSREVILRRLVTLDRADIGFYRTWRQALLAIPVNANGGRKGRPGVAVMTVRDVGKPFARLVLDAYRTNALTGGDVSELLGVRLRHLPAIEARLAGPDMLTGGER